MAAAKGGLGKGLYALIARASSAPGPENAAGRTARVGTIRPGPWQPRRDFPEASLEELARSIREHGILQPLLVRSAGDGWELIAGERRLRAAKLAGLEAVPVRVLEADDRAAAELALIENLQRDDLDPVEEAEGYARLAEIHGLSQEQIAGRVGKARATVANAIRLLALPAGVLEWVRDGSLSAGHAKALLSLPGEAPRRALARRCVREGWSVRELEKRLAPRSAPRSLRRPSGAALDAHRASLLDRLRDRLGTKIGFEARGAEPGGRPGRGRLTIEFYSQDDLDRLFVLLGVSDEGL